MGDKADYGELYPCSSLRFHCYPIGNHSCWSWWHPSLAYGFQQFPNQFCYWHLYHNELMSRGRHFRLSSLPCLDHQLHTWYGHAKGYRWHQSKASSWPCSDHPHGRGLHNKHVLQSPCWSTWGHRQMASCKTHKSCELYWYPHCKSRRPSWFHHGWNCNQTDLDWYDHGWYVG